MLLELPPLPMTVEQAAQLPDVDGVRYELVEGNLVVMNAFYAAWHGDMIRRLTNVFLAAGRPAYSERGVRTGPRSLRSADVGVFHHPLPDLRAAIHDPAEFSHVVEVTSPDDRDRDWHEKAREYAAAGIPEYWIVEEHDHGHDGLVHLHRLTLTGDARAYVVYQQSTVSQLEAEGLPASIA